MINRVGCVAIASVLGLMAACGTDKVTEYVNNAKVTEARLMLNILGKRMKEQMIMTNALPKGSAPLTPAAACCTFPDQKCPPDAAAWQSGLWAELEFHIDEPHRFQYDVTSDGTSLTAHAVGDMSCDGHPVTITMRGTFDPSTGAVTTELDDPTEKKRK